MINRARLSVNQGSFFPLFLLPLLCRLKSETNLAPLLVFFFFFPRPVPDGASCGKHASTATQSWCVPSRQSVTRKRRTGLKFLPYAAFFFLGLRRFLTGRPVVHILMKWALSPSVSSVRFVCSFSRPTYAPKSPFSIAGSVVERPRHGITQTHVPVFYPRQIQ